MAKPKAPLELQILRSFDKDFARLPHKVQEKASEQIERLSHRQFRHPSLRAEKMVGTEDIWKARITRSYRMTFQLADDTLILRRIGAHDILRTP